MRTNKRRTSMQIMLSLLTLLKPLTGIMIAAIITGTLGFLAAFGLGVFGLYALLKAMPDSASLLAGTPFGGFTVRTFLILLFSSGLLRGILHYVEQLFNHLLAFKILAVMRNKVFEKMRNLAPAKLETKNPGQLISLIMGDIELLEVFYAHTISPVAIAFLTTILLFVFYASIHPVLAIVPLLSQIAVGIIFPIIANKMSKKAGMDVRNKIDKLNGQFIDKLKGIREVIQYRYDEKTIGDLDVITTNLLDEQEKIKLNGAKLTSVVDGAIIVFSLLQAFVSILLISNGIIGIGAGVIATILTMSSFSPYIALANLGQILTATLACGERVLALLDEEPIIMPVTDKDNVTFENIELKDLTFRYSDDLANVIDNANLDIKKDEILGIMGESGSGKSTILKLIMRFFDPSKGTIKITGTDLKDINTHCIYNQVNYMTQTVHLFKGSIADNLRLADKNATEDDMVNALKKASVYEYVMNLPNGLDWVIGESGINLSGGERQRLGLARCFLADKNLFLLDEPTSNIDSLNEAMVLRSVVNERKGKTIVFVSHRPSTLAISDRIVEVNEGKVVN